MIRAGRTIDKYKLYAKRYDYQKNARILTLDNKQVVVKEKRKNKKELFNFLDSRDFPYALKPVNLMDDDPFEIYPYIESKVINCEEKAIDMMYILSLLHNKTSFYKEIVLDDIKALYEQTSERIEYLYYYYRDIQDIIEKKIYMAPDEYLLIRNITLVYIALDYAKKQIDNWYEAVKTKKSLRYALLHYKVETAHFIEGDSSYFISWDHAQKDVPIYDFLNFFQSEYQNLDMDSLFNIYKHKYPFTKDETSLFFCLISLPPKIELGKNTYNKYSEVYNFVTYLNKSREFISKQDESYQKTYE